MNKLVVIGYMSSKKCYLNISKEDAVEKYCKSEEITEKEFEDMNLILDEIEFDDVFSAYDVWEG